MNWEILQKNMKKWWKRRLKDNHFGESSVPEIKNNNRNLDGSSDMIIHDSLINKISRR